MDSLQCNPRTHAARHRCPKKKKQEITKLENFKQSIRIVSREYCSESSISGLKHLVDAKTPIVEKIIWVVVLIIGLICSISLVWITFDKYYSAPLVTTQMPEGISVSKIIFPAIGICTNNRISKRAVTTLARTLLKEERNKNYTEEKMLSLLFGLGQLYDLQSKKGISPLILHRILGDYKVHDLIRNLTPRCEDILVKCAWNTEPKDCLDLFDFRLTMNGYCCTFNYLRLSDTLFKEVASYIEHNEVFYKAIRYLCFSNIDLNVNIDMYNYGNKSSFDFDQGLKVLLRLNESDDFYYNVPLQGAQLQFSDAYDFPDAPSGSFAMQIINPEVQMTVTVDASFTKASRDIQHVSIKLRRCRFYDESDYLPFYTHSDCMLKCRMFFLLDKCNCTPFNMLKLPSARTCDMRDVDCLGKFYAQSITLRPDVDNIPPELELDLVNGGISCPMCQPTCSKTTYTYDFNNVIIFPEYLNTVPEIDRDDWLQGANFTGTSIVHVKYAKEVADCYGQNVIVKWFDLISNIGSTCGFVTGFSFVSLLEFIYFYTVKLIREMKRRRKVYNKKRVMTENIKEYEHIERYRPIYWNELTGATRTSPMPPTRMYTTPSVM